MTDTANPPTLAARIAARRSAKDMWDCICSRFMESEKLVLRLMRAPNATARDLAKVHDMHTRAFANMQHTLRELEKAYPSIRTWTKWHFTSITGQRYEA